MTIVKGTDALLSLKPRGRFGYSQDCGTAFNGFVLCGWKPEWAGVYQRKKTLSGWQTSKMKFYWAPQNNTPAKIASMAKFANAVSGWSGLTPTEQETYNKRAYRLRIPGRNLYIREFMRS